MPRAARTPAVQRTYSSKAGTEPASKLVGDAHRDAILALTKTASQSEAIRE